MKKRIKIIISIIFTAPLLATGVPVMTTIAHAETEASNTTASNTESTDTQTDQKTMLERLAEHKAEFKTKLTDTQQTRIKNRCKQAQNGGINSLGGRIKGIETSRNEVHTNLLNRLNKLVEKLKAKSIDTAKLESEIAVLKTKIDTFKTNLAAYKQEIADLKSMDCASDPTAFKAALEAARSSRQKLWQEAIDIRKYINDTIKPTLKDIRSQLEAKEKTESQDSSSNTTTEGNQ